MSMKEETLRFGLKTAVVSIALLTLAVGSFAGPKARKLTADAYLKTAKIEIGYADSTRYPYATVMLDSLFMYYGPYAEGYYWIAKMQIDMNEKTGDLKKKLPYVASAMSYLDSIHAVCNDKNAKANNKKGCDKFTQELDSIKVFYWRTFYNNGVEQLKQITEQATNLQTETDSTAIIEARKIITQNTDSCLDNMNLAITIDPKDARAYIGIANAYEKQDSIERSSEWLMKGLERATTPEERLPLVQQLAISTGSAGKYCDAANYFAEWVRLTAKDSGVTETMSNLAICLNSCEKYDSALAVQKEILRLQPGNYAAMIGIGRYFTEIAGWAFDSSRAHEEAKDSAGAKKWMATRNDRYDTARTYYKQVFEMYPDSASVADQYGLICASRADYANAVMAFERVTRLDPTNVEAWTSLGDCYLYLKRLKEAIVPYEKVIEAQPTNKAVLQQLKNLYHEQGNTSKEAEVDAKLKKL